MLEHHDLGSVLRFMRKALAGLTEFKYPNFIENTLQLMANAQVIDVPSDAKHSGLHQTIDRINKQLSDLIAEAFQYLLHNCYITRPSSTPNFPGYGNTEAFRVTQKGKEWASGSEPIPEDAVGYMRHLTTLVPNRDRVVEQYVQEALVTYERKAYFAAAVMIGAASEKAMYLLAGALERSTKNAHERNRIANAIEDRKLKALLKAISSTLERSRKLIPNEVQEGVAQHLLSFFESIRVQRNDAVHPAAGTVNPDTVRLAISTFPQAYKKVHDLVGWLKTNKI